MREAQIDIQKYSKTFKIIQNQGGVISQLGGGGLYPF